MQSSQRIFVLGGSGFIGQRVCAELVSQQYQVSALGLPRDYFPDDLRDKLRYTPADFDKLTDAEVLGLFSGHDALIYALGPDDRAVLPAGVSAREFFQQHLVERTARAARLARSAGVRRLILLGSYFTHFNDHGLGSLPAGQLAKHHPYIGARQRQYARATDEISDVVLIQIPYVFGVTPPWPPIWRKVILDNFAGSPFLFFGQGGSTALSVQKLARAIVQSIALGEPGDKLAVGADNLSYREMLTPLLRAAEVNKPLLTPPTWLFSAILRVKWWLDKLAKRENGLDFRYLAQDVLARDFYVDYQAVDARLGLHDYLDDTQEAIVQAGLAIR